MKVEIYQTQKILALSLAEKGVIVTSGDKSGRTIFKMAGSYGAFLGSKSNVLTFCKMNI